jgi:hypothetical protein
MSIFSPKREGAFNKFSIFNLSYFSLGVAYLFCCWKVIGSGGGVTGLSWTHRSYSS